jgi:citrate/tricarballylate utilization protein
LAQFSGESPEGRLRVPHYAESTAFNSNAQRVMAICNACRYCEGYCAVFPAIERQTVFSSGDLHYLANLCHNCSECYYACPYTPPHEFAVNVPKLFAELRAQSYRESAWPHSYGGTILPALAVSLLVFLWGAQSQPAPTADFYRIIPHSTMIAIFGAVAGLVLAMLVAGVLRFWRKSGSPAPSATPGLLLSALRDAMTLRYLSGGTRASGMPDSNARRWFHHFTFYGFLLCFASTTAAAIEHYLLGLRAPYPFLSVPVIFGTLGGVGLLIGPAGLYFIKLRRDPAIRDPDQNGADVSFLALLFATSLTGLSLLALRDSPAMGILLRVHLGVVLALFLSLPYGKFVHGGYRLAALIRYAFETASPATRKAR